MLGLQTYQTNCLLQTNTPALHFRVGSRHHGKHGSHVSQQRKLTSCLLQSFFQDFSFYSQICMFVSKPSCLLSYLSNMKLCNNFYEHFRTLHDWLKNTVRLFSAYPNKETRKKVVLSCLEILFGCIFDSPGYKSSQYFVISKALKPEAKQVPKKPDVI